jgi:hypothetical protein
MTLAHRPSPEQARYRPAPAPAPAPARPNSGFFRLFPEEPDLPPSSTAPPRLEEGGRGKRKRAHTERYQQGVEQGDIERSHHGA